MTHSFCKDVISNMTARLKDPDIARLFENSFPNTLGMHPPCPSVSTLTLNNGLDTTVKYFNEVYKVNSWCEEALMTIAVDGKPCVHHYWGKGVLLFIHYKIPHEMISLRISRMSLAVSGSDRRFDPDIVHSG